MAECYTQKTSAAWNEATSRSNLGLFRQASTSEMMMLTITVMIMMKLLVTNMTPLFRAGENLTLALEMRLAQLREPFTFGGNRLHQCSVANVYC